MQLPLPLLALAISAFAIGTTEFVIMGLLPDIAVDLNCTLPAAGLLVSGYALGVVVGAPILASLTSRMPNRRALLLLMCLFVAGNLLCAMAPGYAVLMLGRVVASFTHGAFFGLGAVVATRYVPPAKRASAIALMFTGLTAAIVLGVPLGTFVGQLYGWRVTFLLVTGMGLLSLGAIYRWVPNLHESQDAEFLREARLLLDPQIILALFVTVLGFGSVFVVFTFIAPLLVEVTRFEPTAVSGILLLFGVGVTLGNTIGGKFADKNLMLSLMGSLAVTAFLMGVFAYTCQHKVAAVITVFLWGIAAFSTVPALQMRVVDKAREASRLASTLNIGAFNLGNAAGAFLGGVILSEDMGLQALPWVSAAVAGAGLTLVIVSRALDRRRR